MVSRYFQYFFLNFSGCLRPLGSSFNVFFFVFVGKNVRNENAEDVQKLAKKMTYGAIDGPSTHQRSVGGSVCHEDVFLPRKYQGIMTKCEATERSMDCPVDPLVLTECSLSTRFERF